MNNLHLSEQQLQHYADAPNQISASDRLHLDNCVSCQTQLADYQLISNALKEMQVPVFDFDLNDLVPESAMPAKKMTLPWIAVAAAVTGIFLVSLALTVFSSRIILLTSMLNSAQLYLLSLPLAALCITQLVIQLIHYHRAMHKAIQEKITFLQPNRDLSV